MSYHSRSTIIAFLFMSYIHLTKDFAIPGPNGKKITNPLVVCLNLTGCETEETGQARIRFQFGVWDASIKHWECCPISSVVLNLQNTQELLSVGYKSLGILDRHLDSCKNTRPSPPTIPNSTNFSQRRQYYAQAADNPERRRSAQLVPRHGPTAGESRRQRHHHRMRSQGGRISDQGPQLDHQDAKQQAGIETAEIRRRQIAKSQIQTGFL
jgi:hypothetical protein